MGRFVVTTRRELRGGEHNVPTALHAVSSTPQVKVVGFSDPDTVTIDTDEDTANRLREELATTHYVEPEVRRGLA